MLPRFHAVTFGSDSLPSVRHRFLAFRDALAPHMQVSWGTTLGAPDVWLLRKGDVLFIQKRLPPAVWSLLLSHKIPAVIVYDFDDAIWTWPRKRWSLPTRMRVDFRFNSMMRRATKVFAANGYLLKHALNAHGDAVRVPMGVRLPQYVDVGDERSEDIVFGWNGHPQSHYLIEGIEKDIAPFFSGNKSARLVVLSGARPKLGFDFEWVPWSADREEEFFRVVDVGLAPSTNSMFDLGKSPIKILQHFAHARTVVSNGKGATLELLSTDAGYRVDEHQSWFEVLSEALVRPKDRVERGMKGRALVEQEYDLNLVRQRFVSEILAVAQG